MKKALSIFLPFLLFACSTTDIYSEKGYGFSRENNQYTSDYRKHGTMISWLIESKEYPKLGYVTAVDDLQIYALMPNELDKGFSMHGVFPLLPIPFVFWPSFSEKTYPKDRRVGFMLSFMVEDIQNKTEDYFFDPEKIYLQKEGKKYYPQSIEGAFMHKSPRGRIWNFDNAIQYKDESSGKYNISKMQTFKGISCTTFSDVMCVASRKNFFYFLLYDFKYEDLNEAVLVFDGIEKGNTPLKPMTVTFDYSEGWVTRVLSGP